MSDCNDQFEFSSSKTPDYSQAIKESVTFFMFMKQSICRDNPWALHYSVACEDAGSACARFVCTQPYQDTRSSFPWEDTA